MIEEKNGKSRSTRTKEEEDQFLKAEFDRLSPDERAALQLLLEEAAGAVPPGLKLYDKMVESEWLRKPVPIAQFVHDPYFLGATCSSIYPKLLADLEELFSGDYNEAIWTGCLSHDTLVQGADGSLRTLGEWIGNTGEVALLSGEKGLQFARTGIAKDSGVRAVVRVVLANGMQIDATEDHKIQIWLPTKEGTSQFAWKPAGELQLEDRVVVARRMTTKPSSSLSETAGKLLGHWMARPSSKDYRSQHHLTNEKVLADVLSLLGELGWEGRELRNPSSKFLRWLEPHGVLADRTEIFVSDAVCRASNAVVAGFLNRLWAVGGCCLASKSPDRPPRITLELLSERAIRQVQLLLLRFGIYGRISFVPRKDSKSRGGLLQISGSAQLLTFLSSIGPVLGQEVACSAIRTYCETSPEKIEVTSSSKKRRKLPSSVGVVRVRSVERLATPIPTADVCDVAGYHSWLANGTSVSNSIGSGKTYVASIGMCRVLYELSCLRHPHKTLGIAPGSNISLACLSVNEDLAMKVAYDNIATKIDASPYFREHFAYERTKKELRFPNSVWVAARATTDTSVLGMNTIAAFMDEANFMPKKVGANARGHEFDHATTLYNALKRRMKSRFERNGKLPGMLFVVSSKKTADDFTAKHIRESKNDPNVFVRDYCLTGDTKILLAYGRTHTLKELTELYGDTEERFSVYSYDTSLKRTVVGSAYRPRMTLADAPILRIYLDSGACIKATPWHPFLLRTGQYRIAQELKPGDSLMPLTRPSKYVVSLIEAGENEAVYDLSVEEHENFALDSRIFVHNSLWETKEEGFEGPRFSVLCGNEALGSKILDPEEDGPVEDLRKTLPENCVIIDVPETFRKDFERDLESAIRDIAGISTVAISPFIQRREKIMEAVDSREHPFTTEYYDPSKRPGFMWDRMVKMTEERDFGITREVLRPIINPGAIRHIHIDPSINGDATGFCMSHIGGFKNVIRRAEDGRQYNERAPVYIVDFILRIVPPVGSDIQLRDVRQLVYEIAQKGYIIGKVSLDSFQSVDTLQQLEKKGYAVEVVSVDKSMEPYETLKEALYENRLYYYKYPMLLDELRKVEIDRVRRKIDHPKKGTKDLSDALAGCVFTLMGTAGSTPIPISRGKEEASGDAWLDSKRREAALEARQLRAEADDSSPMDELPPFFTGTMGDDWSGGWDNF